MQCHWGVGLFFCQHWEVFLVLHLKQNKKLFLLEYAKQYPKCVLWRQCWQSRRKLYGQFNAKLSKRAQVLFRHKAENPQRLTEESWDCFFPSLLSGNSETGSWRDRIRLKIHLYISRYFSGKSGSWRAWLSLPCCSGEPAKCCVCGGASGWGLFSCSLCLVVTTQLIIIQVSF